jgi:hypothetical protein
LNSLVSGDADAQVGWKDATFGVITCKAIIIQRLFNSEVRHLGSLTKEAKNLYRRCKV